jgi:hypothetical protein
MTFASVSISICSARDLIGHDWPAVSDPYAVIELVYMTTQVLRTFALLRCGVFDCCCYATFLCMQFFCHIAT